MKKTLSVILALILISSLSTMAFADATTITDNATAIIPVSIRQEFIDETPEGQYLADIKYVPINDDFYQYEALYLPINPTHRATIEGSKYVRVYHSSLGTHIMYYYLYGTFTYDGTTATCTSFAYNRQYLYGSGEPTGDTVYTYVIRSEDGYRQAERGYVRVVYAVYGSGQYVETVVATPTIACEPYGEIY
ncbi:MAG: hypothetical protein IKU17_09430 [Clostridia bacterium]|nr:hypothetical protein [Clostridia bacterium]